jgi:hypothetical protein
VSSWRQISSLPGPARCRHAPKQSDWQLNVYSIAYQGEYPSARLIEKAKELAVSAFLF